jgi:hypothetical protein
MFKFWMFFLWGLETSNIENLSLWQYSFECFHEGNSLVLHFKDDIISGKSCRGMYDALQVFNIDLN